jgi:formylglycine-generating enzyme
MSNIAQNTLKQILTDDFSFDMIFVEGGTFMMGSKDDNTYAFESEKPAHLVKLDSFYIGKYPVTQALWKIVMNGKNPSAFISDNSPVESISWDDIQGFLKIINHRTSKKHRLPTEAEWEYAAKGGQYFNDFPFMYSDKLNEMGWYEENSHGVTKSVGLKLPNLLGIYDMSGNVWEWCRNNYSTYEDVIEQSLKDPITGALVNLTGFTKGSLRVIRGGSWFNNIKHCRATYRDGYKPSYSGNHIGFRLVLDCFSL